jgi:LytR cell envelope-related transcriptional attenuator
MKTTYKMILGVLLVALVSVGGWWAFNSQSGDDLAKLSANAGAKLTEAQVDAVVARISKFMVVPEGERPSVVVLKGTAELAQQQAFYKDAKDGDILIVYSSRAIIYDAKANKLVGVSPIAQNTATPVPTVVTTASGSAQLTPTPSAAPVAPENVTIEVRNGTTTSGLAGKTASDLKKNTWVTSTTAADAKGTYKATVIVDLTGGKKPGAIAALEKLFGVTAVTALPTGEAKSTSDILVIVGK